MVNSAIPKFFEKNLKERLSIVQEFTNLTDEEIKILENATGGIDFSHADKMIENAIGTFLSLIHI